MTAAPVYQWTEAPGGMMTRFALLSAAALVLAAPRASALDDGAAELLRKVVIRGVAAGKVIGGAF